MSNQSVHISIFEANGEYPYDYEQQLEDPNTPTAHGTGSCTLTAYLDPLKEYEVWIRDAFAKPFTGTIEEEWEGTSLFLEPKSIWLPYLNIQQGSTLVLVTLKIHNVQNLKQFHIKFTYNSSILEPWPSEYTSGRIDTAFYLTSGGWTGHSINGLLAKTFTGSSIMFVYGFKVIQTGFTEISLTTSELIDDNGKNIPFGASGSTINVLSLEEWIDEEYAELMEKYGALSTNFVSLNSTYHSLLSNNTQLQEYYDYLNSSYSLLQIEYASLTSSYNEVESEHTAIKNELNNIKNTMYVLSATTLILIVTTVYFAKKKQSS